MWWSADDELSLQESLSLRKKLLCSLVVQELILLLLQKNFNITFHAELATEIYLAVGLFLLFFLYFLLLLLR